MRGNALFQLQPLTKDDNDAARTLFEQALKIDPNDVGALAGDAVACVHEKIYGWTNPETDYEAKILGQTERAIVLAPDSELAVLCEELLPLPFAPLRMRRSALPMRASQSIQILPC